MISRSAENTARGPTAETRKRSKSDHQKPRPHRTACRSEPTSKNLTKEYGPKKENWVSKKEN